MSLYRVTKNTAAQTIQSWFSSNPEVDELSVSKIYALEGRDPNRKSDKRWLTNKLSAMRDHDLFEKHYEKNRSGTKVLAKITLTANGREIVSSLEHDMTAPHKQVVTGSEITPDTVLRDIRILRRKMPLWNVIFELRPKEEDDM